MPTPIPVITPTKIAKKALFENPWTIAVFVPVTAKTPKPIASKKFTNSLKNSWFLWNLVLMIAVAPKVTHDVTNATIT